MGLSAGASTTGARRTPSQVVAAASAALRKSLTGLVGGLLGVEGAPTGDVNSAFAGEAFDGGATLEGVAAGAADAFPRVAGAAAGGVVGAYASTSSLGAAALPVIAGGAAGGARYLAVEGAVGVIRGH